VKDEAGDSQEFRSAHFCHEGFNGLLMERCVRGGKIDQIAVVSDDRNRAADSVSLAEGDSVVFRQRFSLPLIAVLEEYLNGPATHTGAALECPMKPSSNRHVRANKEFSHSFSDQFR
jgi:hypothetical protein